MQNKLSPASLVNRTPILILMFKAVAGQHEIYVALGGFSTFNVALVDHVRQPIKRESDQYGVNQDGYSRQNFENIHPCPWRRFNLMLWNGLIFLLFSKSSVYYSSKTHLKCKQYLMVVQ